MSEPSLTVRTLATLAVGAVLGVSLLTLSLIGREYLADNWTLPSQVPPGDEVFAEILKSEKVPAKPTPWPPRELFEDCNWVFLRVDDGGWSTGDVGSYEDLGEYIDRTRDLKSEITIPIFPSVYKPQQEDELYYDEILASDIQPGDKVLVIGTGSGADAWMASLKSQSLVYVVEINPLAVINAKTTARLANFQIKAVVGDIQTVELPEDFKDFDFVLWNMPFIQEDTDHNEFRGENFHDGDDGTILKKFLAMLPQLLKPNGQAILLNMKSAKQYIDFPQVITKTFPETLQEPFRSYMLFVIPDISAESKE